jgi:hypothetical protein
LNDYRDDYRDDYHGGYPGGVRVGHLGFLGVKTEPVCLAWERT